MNERIRELVIQADKYANDICDTDANADWYDTRDEKFAELIVRECAQVAEEVDGDSRARKCVLKHFGVEK
jgi:hypothetical protein